MPRLGETPAVFHNLGPALDNATDSVYKPLLSLTDDDIKTFGFMSFAPWGILAAVVFLSSSIIGINLTADALAKALGIDRIQKAPV